VLEKFKRDHDRASLEEALAREADHYFERWTVSARYFRKLSSEYPGRVFTSRLEHLEQHLAELAEFAGVPSLANNTAEISIINQNKWRASWSEETLEAVRETVLRQAGVTRLEADFLQY
jgi:hypothetical protein